MKLTIIGLPQSGVTTVFNALTGRHEDPTAYTKPGELVVAMVKVPDERVDVLAEMYQPKKITHAAVEYLEVPGLFAAAGGGATSDGGAAATVRDADACVKVLRAFDNDAAPNPRGSNDPVRDLRDINDELLLLDMAVIEKRVDRLRKDVLKPTPHQDDDKMELAAMERCLAAVEEGKTLDQVELNEQEEKRLRGYGFLTIKPCINVVNIDEGDIGAAEIPAGFPPDTSLAFCAGIEEELEQLDDADRAEFLADLGIESLARERLIRMSYQMLGLISFLTVGEDEVRAWTLESGETALDAAGTIHSDLARGFIRAEVMKYGDLAELGSEREVKAKGLAKLEGRDYVVQDGDILNIRFNV
jgi:ribosome-binding ATPase